MEFMLLSETGGNAMQQLETTANNFFGDIQPYVWIAVAVAMIVNGIMMAVGGEEGRQRAKKAFPWVLLGCVCGRCGHNCQLGGWQYRVWRVSNEKADTEIFCTEIPKAKFQL